MQSNTFVLEQLQNIAGTTDGGSPTLNSSTLPVLFAEFETAQKHSAQCGAILDTIKNDDGAAILLTAVAGAKQKYDSTLTGLQQKIAKQTEAGFDDVDRHAFVNLDVETQAELKTVIASDDILREAQAMIAAKSQTMQQSNYSTYSP